jgi:hypothetical protein
MKLQPIVPKTRGDKFLQDAVRAWREQGLYPDWLSHLLSYIPYDKLEQCGVWLESIDSLAGSCNFDWSLEEQRLKEPLQQICKALTAIFHHIGAIPRTQTVEYSLDWDLDIEVVGEERKGERQCNGIDFSFDPQNIYSTAWLSTEIKAHLCEEVEPLAAGTIVGIDDFESDTHITIPFKDKRELALHYMNMGMTRHQVQVFLRQYLKDPKFDLGVYPIQVTFDREMWVFADYDTRYEDTAMQYREDEGVAIARKAGQYDNLLLAVLEIFEEAV